MLRSLFGSRSSRQGISSFQALALAISGRVGTGNIAGTATAICYGGPGSLFWMWVVAFLGAASAFVESTLAQLWKVEIDGQYRGGPAYYMEYGLRAPGYALLFAVATIISCGLFLPGVQANAIAAAMHNAFGWSVRGVGLILALLLALIICGGVQRIAKVSQVVAPLMALGYLAMGGVILIAYRQQIPEVFSLIFACAFDRNALFGGLLGSAISWGVRRGVYSNEAGQGTVAHAAAAAEVAHPAQQGLVQAFSVYIDTLCICTLTGLMLLVTGAYNVLSPQGQWLVANLPQVEAGPGYAQAAVSCVFPGLGPGFVAVALGFFAFTSMICYYYHAESNLAYVWQQQKGRRRLFTALLRLATVVLVFHACLNSSAMAWALGDLGVGLMAWLNVIAILCLRKPALALLADFEAQCRLGQEPVFDPRSLEYPHTGLWERICHRYRR